MPSPYIPARYCEIVATDACYLALWTNRIAAAAHATTTPCLARRPIGSTAVAHATTAPPLIPNNTVSTLPIAQCRHFINMAPIGTAPIRSRHCLGEHLNPGSTSLGNTISTKYGQQANSHMSCLMFLCKQLLSPAPELVSDNLLPRPVHYK